MISLVLGLGNVGRKYTATRHNLGFEVVDRVRDALKAEVQPNTEEYNWAVARLDEGCVTLGWPRTFVNLSGAAAKKLLFSTGLSPAEMLVVVDDFNLPLGTLRFRTSGSDGGHNGLSSLIEVLGTKEFPRLRMGIGPIPAGADVVKFVLGQFDPSERERVDPMVGRAAAAVLFGMTNRFEEVMSRYNVNPALPEN
jgi:PTH1 family peptidyl-tRNA hydrolase